MRSVENAKCGKCEVWKAWSVERAECRKCVENFNFPFQFPWKFHVMSMLSVENEACVI